MSRFKDRLGDRLQFGFWLMSASSLVAEAAAGAGFDWLLIDMEHSPNELPGVIDQLRAVALAGATAIVRPPANDRVIIKRLLDAGADALLIPYVQTEADARHAVSAMRYPPHGVRGFTGTSRANDFGRRKDYARNADAGNCLIVQIESAEAVRNVAAIAAVDGVDALFIGPADLAVDLGHFGVFAEPEAWSQVLAAVRTAVATGKPCGILVSSLQQVSEAIAAGASFVGIGADLSLVARQAEALLAAVRPA